MPWWMQEQTSVLRRLAFGTGAGRGSHLGRARAREEQPHVSRECARGGPRAHAAARPQRSRLAAVPGQVSAPRHHEQLLARGVRLRRERLQGITRLSF